MFALVNRDRAAHGKPPLAYDERLSDVARGHADDMQRNRFFAHDSPTWGTLDDRLTRAQISLATARENLAEAVDVEAAEQSLMKSPGHFANVIADDVSHIGVGIVTGGAPPSAMLFVQVFARPVVQESPKEAKAAVLARITSNRAAKGLKAPTIDPVLDELADQYVNEVDDEMSRGSLDSVGKRVLEDMTKKSRSSLAVVVSGQRVVAASEYEPTPSLLSKAELVLGIGAGKARDERGRPAVKVLVLMYA